MRCATRHQQQQLQQQFLAEGSTVEDTSGEEGFKGVWFEATILRVFSSALKKKRILVQCQSILADENGSEPLKELVNISFVLPVPPVEIADRFELYLVDASYNDGWWTGVVTRVLDDSGYQVTFNNPPDELEFGISELRFHKQWVKGNWVQSGKQFGIKSAVLNAELPQSSRLHILEEFNAGLF